MERKSGEYLGNLGTRSISRKILEENFFIYSILFFGGKLHFKIRGILKIVYGIM